MTRNLLAEETSPYLLQHKDNPVHWRPWGSESLAVAKRENKPILLSIGYAACHWCHVMAHESFEDDAIAGLMNELFVSIKVDREERPDIDAIYQSALQMMGDHGGWPLTMFLTPDGEPFWGGTYFPATALYGRPAFPDLLKSIATTFRTQNGKVLENAKALKDGLSRLSKPEGTGAPSMEKLDQAAAMILRIVDTHKGGTLGAPKFPQPSLFQFLWHAHRRTGAGPFREAVTTTLDHLCQGGIYDHLGGGFARYSTDEAWLAPHFEKMLYDNALLIELLSDVWQQTKNPLYAVRVRETIDWALREMRSTEDGPFGFTSALDADSEGREGKFYIWTEEEIDGVLGTDAGAFKEIYDVTPGGNWEGHTILNRSKDLTLGDDDRERRLLEAREKLLAVRAGRIRPQRDDKVLADWNGLMIAALAKAGAVFGQPAWIETAADVFRFIADTMTENGTENGRLKHSWCAGRLSHPATVDDYAAMARAALVLLGVTGKDEYLTRALGWVGIANAHYWDDEGNEAGGGYFLGADDTEDVIARTKAVHDNAVPSGNGIMAEVLARLFHITGEAEHRERAEQLFQAIAGKEAEQISHQPSLMNAFELLRTGVQIVIAGTVSDAEAENLRRAVFDAGLVNRVVTHLAADADLPGGHPARGKGPVDGKPAVYICVGPTCRLPIVDAELLREELARL
ncbi:MAG: thioredoxin domain-containing protein [Proteobacteria bacterium]|nr:thioredoxin domain-containing protein [Pseudomonadota bacterium]